MTVSDRECFVFIALPQSTEFVTAGRFRWLEEDGEYVGEFVYGQSYRDRKDAVAIDPVELRLTDSMFRTTRLKGFFGAIRDAIPDDWGRRIIERRKGRTDLSEFDYLAESSDDRIGALAFGTTTIPPTIREQHTRISQLEEIQQAADQLLAAGSRSEISDEHHVLDLLILGTSIGGARPKTQVKHAGDLWIAKFNRHDDRWNHPRVEHGLLELARLCGLSANASRIEKVGGRDALLVRRFDRYRAALGVGRLRMVSALTLLRTDEQDWRNWSYLTLADEIRRCVANPQEDLRELFARMCFNAAVSNLDDHPRNHAIIAPDTGWELSPAFDLTPSPVVSHERDLAMNCGMLGRRANRANLTSAYARFMLSRDEATTLFDKITEIVGAQWRTSMLRAGVSRGDCEIIAPAFLNPGLWYEPHP